MAATEAARIDAPGAACNYTETGDAANNVTAEASGLTVGAQDQTLCGQVDNGHYGSASKTVDVDTYTVTVGATTAELIVRFENSLPAGLTDFQVAITDTNTDADDPQRGRLRRLARRPRRVSRRAADRDVQHRRDRVRGRRHPARRSRTRSSSSPISRPRVARISTAMPADYTEANDGASNNGNDVVLIDFSKNPSFSLTSATTDAPEPTGLTVDSSKSSHLVGSSASVAAGTDKYLDRDTYAIMTGASTNELSIRLNWPGSTSDLDYVVVPGQHDHRGERRCNAHRDHEDEFATFAVKPSTSYWVWVGAYKGSTGMPVAYSASVCGATFTP